MPTIIATNADHIVAQQTIGGYVPHVFASESQFESWMQFTRPRGIVAPTSARGRCFPAIDHRKEIETMTTTQNRSPLGEPEDDSPRCKHGQPYSGKDCELCHPELDAKRFAHREDPKLAAKVYAEKKPATPAPSAALEELRALRAEVRALAAQMQSISALLANTDPIAHTVHAVLASQLAPALAEALRQQTATQPAAQPEPGNAASRTRETIRIVKVTKSVDEKTGEMKFRAMGGRFMQYGIPIYAEHLAACGIDDQALKFGPNDCNRDMIAEFETNGDGQPKPKRVISLA